jgi:virginiamycin A acetyltransferase
MNGPHPKTKFPVKDLDQIVYLNQVVTSPLIEIGDYTYYHDFERPEDFEKKCVLYHFDFIGDRLIMGKFCAIACGARFIMSGANHSQIGFATYPFFIFGNGWEKQAPDDDHSTHKGDIVLENDVWLGYQATVLPGITIGDGAIVGAKSVVTRDVEPYTIVGGNPARVIRKRFDDATIDTLLRIKWWDWPVEKITANMKRILSGDRDWLAAQ